MPWHKCTYNCYYSFSGNCVKTRIEFLKYVARSLVELHSKHEAHQQLFTLRVQVRIVRKTISNSTSHKASEMWQMSKKPKQEDKMCADCHTLICGTCFVPN